MIKKDFIPTRLLWVDLEMTGLEPAQDVILEVAAVVTDFDFKSLATYEARLQQPRKAAEQRMSANPFWTEFAHLRDEFLAGLAEGRLSDEVEEELVKLVEENFGSEPAVLAGNSIYNDRQFIKQYWPRLEAKLHYRMLDVSAWKVLMQGKYGVEFKKEDIHRARGDILASIDELKFYLQHFSG